MIVSFYAKLKNNRRIQVLVGKYNGRYVKNPFHTFNEQVQLEIEFDDATGGDYRRFSACTTILDQPYI